MKRRRSDGNVNDQYHCCVRILADYEPDRAHMAEEMKAPEEQATELTDQKLEKLEREIAKRYVAAEKDLYKEIHAYFAAIAKEDEKKAAELAAGTITKEEYKQWRLKRMTTGEEFEKLRDKIASRFLKANMDSDSLINETTPEIFALNHNYEAYKAEMAVNEEWP